MNRNRLLNAELSHAVASMGHGDLMIVCDAGFPIPQDGMAHRPRDRPGRARPRDGVVSDRAEPNRRARRICRRVATAQRAAAREDQAVVSRRGSRAGQAESLLSEMAAKAKVIVRTGAFDPWGNILLYSGVDVPAWFSKPRVVAPEYYAKKLKG